MNLKKLTQAVFEGLPKEYRWAVVNKYGDASCYTCKPELLLVNGEIYWNLTLESARKSINNGYDITDWQNSLIERLSDTCIDDMGIANAQKQSERQDVPTADIDWSRQDVPEGATHWHKDQFIRWTGNQSYSFGTWDMDAWLGGAWALAHWGWQGTLETFLEDGAIPRPEPITDTRKDPVLEMARSIEAARVAEQSERTYPHYFKDVSAVDAIDLYHVARLYDITDPALFHAFKKIACAGKRGAKDQAQDVQEAIDALQRWQELSA